MNFNIQKFFDIDAPVATTPTTNEPTSIASLMAKQGVKNEGSDMVATPIIIPEKKEEPKTETTPQAAMATAEKTETATPETPLPEKAEPTPQPQTEKEEIVPLSWQEVLRQQQPQHDQILKELGYDGKLVELLNDLKEVDPKMLTFLNQWKNKEDLVPYLREMTTDYSKMSAEEVMRHQLRRDYPKANEKQLDLLFNTRIRDVYKLDSEDEDEKLNGQLLLEAEAEKYRDGLLSKQQDYLFPKPPEPKPSTQELEMQERQKDFEAYDSHIKGDPYTRQVLSSKQITVGEGDEKFNYPVKPEAVMEMILDPDKWAQKFFIPQQQNGKTVYSPDVQKLWLVNAFASDMNGFLKAYAQHLKTIGAKEAVAPIENASESKGSTTPTTPASEPKTPAEAMARQGRFNSGGYQ